MTVSSSRPRHVSIASLILSAVFFIIVLLVGRWSGFFAVWAMGWMVLSAALIWLVLLIQFHQRCLAEQEKLDMTELAEGKQTSTIFQAKGRQAELFAIAQKRLKLFEKWFLPIFSAIIAVFQIAIGVYLIKSIAAPAYAEPEQPLICAICMTAIAFISFLMSRYTTAMSAVTETPQWKPLRAGAGFLLAVAVLSFALAISLALAQFKIFVPLNIIGYVICGTLIILGLETSLNVVMDIYRPRIEGKYNRAAFDSRLLGIINEPGEMLHTAAGAIDYQFGFKVSQTWFYKLLEKAVVPLILFAAVILYLMSCVVIVSPDEEAIIEHFGNPLTSTGLARKVGPGPAFKAPWPIDIAYKYPTQKIMELSIGFVPKEYKPGQKREALIWGKSHYQEEYNLLVASEHTAAKAETGAVPVSLLVAAVPVQYKVKDLYAFRYNHNEPEKLLESICYRELTKYAAGAKIEVDNESEMSHRLLGGGSADTKRILTTRIQDAVDKEKLGIEIVFLGVQGIHPPPQVAADYQKVVGAVQTSQKVILDALAERNKTLSNLAGSVKEADQIYSFAERYQQAKDTNDTKAIEKLAGDLDNAFSQAKGDIFVTLRQSQSYAFEKATLAEAVGKRFAGQLKAYQAAPDIYKQLQRLAVFEQALEKIRKYIVVADTNDTQVFIVDVKEKLTPNLYELGGIEENSGK